MNSESKGRNVGNEGGGNNDTLITAKGLFFFLAMIHWLGGIISLPWRGFHHHTGRLRSG